MHVGRDVEPVFWPGHGDIEVLMGIKMVFLFSPAAASIEKSVPAEFLRP
jgi:hypothetical protein